MPGNGRNKQDEREHSMTKEKFLTVRWNNWLSLGLGLPALMYVIVVLSTSVLSVRAGFIGMVIIGVLY
jgi:hypothetical protein